MSPFCPVNGRYSAVNVDIPNEYFSRHLQLIERLRERFPHITLVVRRGSRVTVSGGDATEQGDAVREWVEKHLPEV